MNDKLNRMPMPFEETVQLISNTDEITPDMHIALSKATDRKDYGTGVLEKRIKENLKSMLCSFLDFVKAANQMDLKVKRTIYYGTGPGTPEYEKKAAAYKAGELFLEQAILEILEKDKNGNFEIDGVLSAVIHYTMGAGTETGEIMESVVKYMHNGEIDLVNIGEEFGDVFWYSSNLFDLLNLRYEVIMAKNSKKLILKRYKNGGFSESQAINRDTNSERTVLAQGISDIPPTLLDGQKQNGKTSEDDAEIRERHLEDCVQELYDLIDDTGVVTAKVSKKAIEIYNKAEIRVRDKKAS
ncbi:hypothetical protein [Bdellovibrio sp. BCCA]|uniref:hypothetical protein n=1 Tax=Bdellovibrio sp. BCCA TaxID=3136281 RepID=UPI0030F08A1E